MSENGKGTQLVATPKRQMQVASNNRGLELVTLDDYWRFAGIALTSKIAPRGLSTREQIMVALQYGAELGLKPMQAMAVTMVVNGRPSLFGDGMLAVAQASGLLVDIKETTEGSADKIDDLACVCTVQRVGRPTPSVGRFSWLDAKRAGLTIKDTYKQYPQRLLKARARAFALHDAFPDVLCGVLSTEESGDIPDDGGKPAFVDGDQQPPADLDALMQTDLGGSVEDDPLAGSDGEQERDDGRPTDEELRRDGLLYEA